MTAFAIAGAILALVPTILIWPHVGVLMWFWIGIMNPHRWAWGSLELLGYAQIVGVATLAAWAVSREPKRVPVTGVTILLGLLTVWITLTSFTARVPAAAWADWDQAFKILVMTFVSVALITTRERLHALIWIAVLSLGFYGLKGGVFTILTGGEYRVWGPPKSFIESNNQLALALIMTLPLMIYLRGQSANVWVRWGLSGLAVLSVVSIVGSQSRGAFLALSVLGAFLVLKSRQRLAIGFAVGLLAGAGLFFVPDTWVQRMETIRNYDQDQSAQGRLKAWTFGVRAALDDPVTGGGFNVFYDEDYFMRLVPDAGRVTNFHSVYFEVLGEHGFVGLGLFLGLFAAAWMAFGRVMRRTRARPDLLWAHELARMAQVSMVGYASAGAFLNLAFYDFYYLVIALAVIVDVLVRQATAAPIPQRAHAPHAGALGARAPDAGGPASAPAPAAGARGGALARSAD